jgi:hypothetical protein
MSSGLFHDDWYTNPPWDYVSRSWLLRYINTIRTNPRLVAAMRADENEFEMVPMPRELLRHLASTAVAPPPAPAPAPAPAAAPRTAIARMASVEIGRVAPELLALIRRLDAALEKGDLAAVMAEISDRYRDASGRDEVALKADLQKLFDVTSARRIVPHKVENVQSSGIHISAEILAAWDAMVTPDSGAPQHRSGNSRVEIVFEKGAAGWKIVSLGIL